MRCGLPAVLTVFCVAVFTSWNAASSAPARSVTPPAPVSLVTSGRAALEDGLYELAERSFGRRLQEAEGDATVTPEAIQESAQYMARTLLEQRKFAEMLEWFKAGRGLTKRMPDQGLAVFWRAYGRWGLGQTGAAIQELDGFENRFPASEFAGRARRLRASCLLKADRLNDALKEYEAYDRDYPGSGEAAENLLDWSRALLLTNGADEAHELLLRIQKMDPPSAVLQECSYWLGQALVRRGEYKKAEETLAPLAASERVPGEQRVRAWYALAGIYGSVTNTERRIAALKEGLVLTRRPEMKRLGEKELGDLLVDLGKLDEGIPLLKSFVAAAPQTPEADEAQLRIAQALLDGGQPSAAMAEFQYYLETFANVAGQAKAYEGKGWAMEALARPAEAAVAFQKAYNVGGVALRRETCLFKVGDCQFLSGQYRQAVDVYVRFLNEFPDSMRRPRAIYQMAESLVMLGRDEDAAGRFGELAQTFPDDGLADESTIRSGELYSRLNQLDKALEAFSRVLARPVRSIWYPQALLGRGHVRYSRLDFGEALADFDRIVNEYPTNTVAEQAFARKGQCLYWVGRDEEALAVSRDFVSQYTNSALAAGVLFWIGNQEYNRGKFPSAEDCFLSLATRYPTNVLADDALLWAGLAASKRKEYVRAVELLARLAEQYPASPKIPEARFAQGDAQTEMGQYAAAILIFDEIIRMRPEGELAARAWGRKGDCQFSLGTEESKRFEESLASYRVVANSSAAGPDLVLQAEYKIARCLEKLGKVQDAFDHYYVHVIARFFQEREKGIWHGEAGKTWFTRAALRAVDILEAGDDWRRVVRILERIVESGVPEAASAKERIEKIKAERWWLFY